MRADMPMGRFVEFSLHRQQRQEIGILAFSDESGEIFQQCDGPNSTYDF